MTSLRYAAPWVRWLSLLLGCLTAYAPLTARGQDGSGSWYVNPYLGGMTPDKPWGSKGSSALFGLDVGMRLSRPWSAELDLSDAPLSDRFGGGTIHLYGAALVIQRVFSASSRLAPYVSIGTGVTHLAPPSDIVLQSRTEFMVQPGLGALINVWKGGDCCRSVALRPDIRLRWTHGWAHAPGNPVDPLYVLGLTMFF